MQASTHHIRSLLLAPLLLAPAICGCRGGERTPAAATAPAPAGATVELQLAAAEEVDRVELVGELPGSPHQLQRRGSRWQLRLGGLRPGRLYRYQFRVHRRDLGRWIRISDPTAWLWDASSTRWSLLRAGTSLAPRLERVPLRTPAPRDLMIYELNPREWVAPETPYADPRRSPGARGPGRILQRITARIRAGYFNRLGVNALELMPLMASAWTVHQRQRPERDPWGYLPLTWYALNGDMGSPEDLARLVQVAHRKGLAVLLDVSLDHGYGGTRHGLLTDLKPSWRRKNTHNPWGLLELDLDRPAVQRFLIGALRRLVQHYDIDGLRLDWTERVPWQRFGPLVSELRRLKPGLILIGENPVADHVNRGGLDGTWDFFFHSQAQLLLRQVFRHHDGLLGHKVQTQAKLVENLTSWPKSPGAPHGVLVRYVESHDLPRVGRERVRWQHGGNGLVDVDGDGRRPDWIAGGGPVASKLGASLIFTVPGAPLLFAGQEHGAGDDLAWRYDPLDWSKADAGVLRHTRRLAHLRRACAALRSDDLHLVLSDDERHLLVYSRGIDPGRQDDDSVLVAFNFGSKPVAGLRLQRPAPGPWVELQSGARWQGPGPLALTLAARSALVLVRESKALAPVLRLR